MTEKETTPFKRIPWNEYKETLERFGYDQDQILEVKKIRENPEIEQITWATLWRLDHRHTSPRRRRKCCYIGQPRQAHSFA